MHDAKRSHVDEGLKGLSEEAPALVFGQTPTDRFLERLVLDVLLQGEKSRLASDSRAKGLPRSVPSGCKVRAIPSRLHSGPSARSQYSLLAHAGR